MPNAHIFQMNVFNLKMIKRYQHHLQNELIDKQIFFSNLFQ